MKKMNTLINRLMCSAVLLPFTVFASAQQPWTLRQCIDYALEHNIQVKQQDVNRLQRELDVSTAKNSRLPDLSASASENFSFGRGLTAQNTYTNTNTSSTSFGLNTSVPLFTGYRIPRTLELQKLNLEAATADLEKAKNDIRMQVAQAYVQILYNMELCDVAKRQISIDSMHVHRLTEMMRNGKASGTEVAQQEASLAQSRLTATQADNDYRLSLLTLSQLLELPSPESFTISRDVAVPEILPSMDLISPDAIYQEALMIKPEIQAEQYRLEGTLKSIDIAKSAKLPNLSFQAGLGSNYYKTSGYPSDGFFKQLNNNFSQYIGLSLSVPIFNRYETRNNIKSAQLNRYNQQLQLDNVKKGLYKEIQQAYYNAVAAQAKYESSAEAKRSQDEAFRLMSAKYEYGKANITEFNEAKNNLMKAESDLVRAKYEYLYQRALTDFYRGRELSFND
ncbi:MAG: TolC family protein [Prevotella sp.]|nr:TolC family protein [Prevotella sp.]